MLGAGEGCRVHCSKDRIPSQVWCIMGSGGDAAAGDGGVGDNDVNLLMAVTVVKLVLEAYDGGQE